MRFSKKLSELIVKKSVQKKTESKDLVWLLNLDMIEQNTGSVIEKNYVPMSEVGNSTHFFEKGTVLYSKLRPYLNKVVVADSDGYATTELVPLKCNEELISPHYLAYFLRSPEFLEFASNVVAGAKMPRMVMSEFWDYEISLPTIEEQHRILSILDKADAIRQKRQQAIAKLDELLQATFIDMFGDPVSNPKGWDVKKLSYLTSKIGSGSTPRGGDSAYQNEGITLIRSLNVYDGYFRYKGLAYIDQDQADKLKNVSLEKGDVLLNITGASVARCCMVPEHLLPARVNQHVSILRTNNLILPEFLMSLLISEPMKNHLLKISGAGATREALTKIQLQNLEVLCPPLDVQVKFLSVFQKIKLTQINFEKSVRELDELFNAVQQKAFNGTL